MWILNILISGTEMNYKEADMDKLTGLMQVLANAGTKSNAFYYVLGGGIVLVGAVLAVIAIRGSKKAEGEPSGNSGTEEAAGSAAGEKDGE